MFFCPISFPSFSTRPRYFHGKLYQTSEEQMIGKAGTKTMGGKRIRREKMKNKFMLKEISSHKIIKHILLLQKIKRKVSSWKFKT